MRNSTTYVISGTKTFRLASRKILGKWGGNLQNVEKGMREIYVPDPGKIFVQVDQSGAEALIVAYCCEDANYRQLFKNGIKPHSYLGMHLFQNIWSKKMRESGFTVPSIPFDITALVRCPIPSLKQQPYWKELDRIIKDSDNWSLQERYYYLAKQTEHSSNYDIKPPMFRMNILEKSGGKIVISKEDSERFLATKFSLFPEITGYHRWVRQCAEQHRMLYNLHGHPYTITHYELLDTHWKELYAWVPQSTVGEITNIAYANMCAFVRKEKLNWDAMANTHDSYLWQCPVEEAKYCAAKGQEFLGQTFKSPIDGTVFQMKSEAAIGYNWRPYHKDKNPDGLRGV